MLQSLTKRWARRVARTLDRREIGRSRRLADLLRRADWPGLAALPDEGLSWRDRWKDRDLIVFARRLSARRASPRPPVALREHHMAGRVQEFHHFVGAILLPFLDYASMHVFDRGDLVLFPDCGFLNGVAQEIAAAVGVEVDFYPIWIAGALDASERLRVIHLPPYDLSTHRDFFLTPDQLATVRAAALRCAGVDEPDDAPVPAGADRVLLIERAPAAAFYLSDRHRLPVSAEGHPGSGRRSIGNADELRRAIAERYRVTVARLEEMSFGEQVQAFRAASVIVGQHGAGLNGVLWARQGAGVVEIIPTNKLKDTFPIFRNLASAAGLRHRHVVQPGPHAAVDAPLVLAAIESVRPGAARAP